jgi:hypothetical protein
LPHSIGESVDQWWLVKIPRIVEETLDTNRAVERGTRGYQVDAENIGKILRETCLDKRLIQSTSNSECAEVTLSAAMVDTFLRPIR